MPKHLVDASDVVCIQADANRFHKSCARKLYGFDSIESAIALSSTHIEYEVVHSPKLAHVFDAWPKDGEGNLIHVIREDEYREERTQLKVHGESIYDSCGHCLGVIRVRNN